jgi:hypothetical protein
LRWVLATFKPYIFLSCSDLAVVLFLNLYLEAFMAKQNLSSTHVAEKSLKGFSYLFIGAIALFTTVGFYSPLETLKNAVLDLINDSGYDLSKQTRFKVNVIFLPLALLMSCIFGSIIAIYSNKHFVDKLSEKGKQTDEHFGDLENPQQENTSPNAETSSPTLEEPIATSNRYRLIQPPAKESTSLIRNAERQTRCLIC